MNAPRPIIDPRTRQALEARVALRLGAGLTERTAELPHDIAERLRVARDQALARAQQVRRNAPQAQASAGVVSVGSATVAMVGGPAPIWQRAAALLPLALMVLGLLLIQQQAEREQVHAAAEVDVQLLADDLPPDAYSDPGFAEFLRKPAP